MISNTVTITIKLTMVIAIRIMPQVGISSLSDDGGGGELVRNVEVVDSVGIVSVVVVIAAVVNGVGDDIEVGTDDGDILLFVTCSMP